MGLWRLQIYGYPVSLDNYRIAQATNGGGWEYYLLPHEQFGCQRRVGNHYRCHCANLFDPANADGLVIQRCSLNEMMPAIERTDNGPITSSMCL